MENRNGDIIEIDLLELWRILRRRGGVLLLALVLGAGLTLAGTWMLVAPVYQTRVQLYINSTDPGAAHKAGVSLGELSASQNLTSTCGVILKSRTTLQEVIRRSGVSYGWEELEEMLTADAVDGTGVLEIQVQSPDPNEAVAIANAIAQVLPERIPEIVAGSSAQVLDPAELPRKPISPNYVRNGILGGILAFAALAAYLLIRELREDRIQDGAQLRRICKLPLLAEVSNLQLPAGKALPEAYRFLRTNLQFAVPEQPGCKCIGITSTAPEEGSTATAIHLAHALAQAGNRVLLMEGDLRRPSLGKRLEMKETPGLSELLSGQCSGKEVLRRSGLAGGLWVVTGGETLPHAAERLGSAQMASALKSLAQVFDWMILDLPAVTTASDGLVLSKLLDGMVLVVRQGHCRRRTLEDALRQLEFAGVNLLGLVLTGTDRDTSATKAARVHRNVEFRKGTASNGNCDPRALK